MSRRKLAAGYSVILAALLMPSVRAQEGAFNPTASHPMMIPAQIPDPSSANMPGQGMSQPASFYRFQDPALTAVPPMPIDADQGGAMALPMGAPGYVRLGGAMYPCPRPNIPIWSGSTVITNQAFAPHEMLYPHTYRAIYPPFYHRVKGGWLLTPLGVRSHEKWELQGTMVQVKYRAHYPGLVSGAFWHPPATSYMGGAWR